MIFVDSSFLISLFLNRDSNHFKAKKILKDHDEERAVSEDVLKETLTVISQRDGRLAGITAYHDIINEHSVLQVTSDRFQEGLKLFLDLNLQKDISLIDCVIVATCKEIKIKRILTFDTHFRNFGLTPLS